MRDLNELAVFSAVVQQSTANAISSGVPTGRFVSRNHSTAASPFGGRFSNTCTTLTRSDLTRFHGVFAPGAKLRPFLLGRILWL